MLPLAKKYGAVLVALCLDDNGIPATAAGRIAVAEKIIARAAEYGIESRNIVVDPLALTISTGADNAAIACEVIRTMKARGINTVMGVSNISVFPAVMPSTALSSAWRWQQAFPVASSIRRASR